MKTDMSNRETIAVTEFLRVTLEEADLDEEIELLNEARYSQEHFAAAQIVFRERLGKSLSFIGLATVLFLDEVDWEQVFDDLLRDWTSGKEDMMRIKNEAEQ